MNHRAPHCQGRCRSLTRKLAAIMRTRLCIQPVAASCRIPASTMPNPVVPAHQRSNRSERVGAGVDRERIHPPVQVLPRGSRPAEQHIGVEVAPRQFAREHRVRRLARARGVEIGEQLTRVDGAPLAAPARAGSCRRPPGRSAAGRSRRAHRRGTRAIDRVPPPPPPAEVRNGDRVGDPAHRTRRRGETKRCHRGDGDRSAPTTSAPATLWRTE